MWKTEFVDKTFRKQNWLVAKRVDSIYYRLTFHNGRISETVSLQVSIKYF